MKIKVDRDVPNVKKIFFKLDIFALIFEGNQLFAVLHRAMSRLPITIFRLSPHLWTLCCVPPPSSGVH